MSESRKSLEMRCKECGRAIARELMEKMQQGEVIYCEYCGAANKLKQPLVPTNDEEEMSRKMSAKDVEISPSSYSPIHAQSRGFEAQKPPFMARFKQFWKRIKVKLKLIYRRLVRVFHSRKSKGKGCQRRRGRRR